MTDRRIFTFSATDNRLVSTRLYQTITSGKKHGRHRHCLCSVPIPEHKYTLPALSLGSSLLLSAPGPTEGSCVKIVVTLPPVGLCKEIIIQVRGFKK